MSKIADVLDECFEAYPAGYFDFEKAEQALHELATNALPNGNSIVQPDLNEVPSNLHWIHFKGQKYAIDQMKASIDELYRDKP